MRRFRICKNIGGPKYIVYVVACFRLMSPLDIPIQYNNIQEQQAKRVPDGHGRSYGSWPWQEPVPEPSWRVLGSRRCPKEDNLLCQHLIPIFPRKLIEKNIYFYMKIIYFTFGTPHILKDSPLALRKRFRFCCSFKLK